MTDKQTGGPAFPLDIKEKWFEGMSLRDYFAAKAMQSLIGLGADSDEFWIDAKQAYKMADAMLEARDEIAVGRKIEDLGLLVKTKNLLKADDICTVEQLTQLTSNHLLKIPNMGRKSVREIEQALFMQGLSLRDGNP